MQMAFIPMGALLTVLAVGGAHVSHNSQVSRKDSGGAEWHHEAPLDAPQTVVESLPGRKGDGHSKLKKTANTLTPKRATLKQTVAKSAKAKAKRSSEMEKKSQRSAQAKAPATKGMADRRKGEKLPRKPAILSVHEKPDSSSSKVAELLQGDVFYARGQRRDHNGRTWLSLSDGSGFVLKAGAAKIHKRDQKKVKAAGKGGRSAAGKKASLISTGFAPSPSTDEIEKVLGKLKKYGEKEDLQLQHFEKTTMSIDGLPQKSRHVNHMTYGADWRAEYPTAPPSAFASTNSDKSGAARAIASPIMAVLAWRALAGVVA